MKVLHIATYDTGGAGIACLRIHNALLNQGIESKVLVRSKSNSKFPHVYEIWEDLSIIEKVKKVVTQLILDKKEKGIQSKIKLIKEFFSSFNSIWDITESSLYQEANIINLHWTAGFLDVESFFKKCDKKIVWTLHDYAPFNGGLHYPNIHQNELTDYQEKNNQIMINALNLNKPHVICPSKYILNQSLKSDLFSKLEHIQIKNCVNTSVFKYKEKKLAKKELNLSANKKVILFIADDISYPRKGFVILSEAIKKMNQKETTCLVIGNNKSKILLNNNIHYKGVITDNQKLSLMYQAADLFVIPSLDDNLPSTISESLCCGTPVIGFKVGGIPEMIINSENGFLCENKNADELTLTLQKAIDFRWDNKSISNAAIKEYNEEKCSHEYVSFYQKIINNL